MQIENVHPTHHRYLGAEDLHFGNTTPTSWLESQHGGSKDTRTFIESTTPMVGILGMHSTRQHGNGDAIRSCLILSWRRNSIMHLCFGRQRNSLKYTRYKAFSGDLPLSHWLNSRSCTSEEDVIVLLSNIVLVKG